jgi:DNA-binding GntR family transcriptional regulator
MIMEPFGPGGARGGGQEWKRGERVNCMQLLLLGELHPIAVVSRRMLSMPRVVQVPDIRKVDLPEARQAIPHVHAYLRECILDGTLKPGTKLSQVSLAAQLGISRTPLREVLRMLQEEGLVEIEPNQRTRVAGLDPQELDDVYASRILLETLALSMTVGHFGVKARGEARRLLAAMRRAARAGDFDAWFAAHADYHRVCTAGAGEAMQRQLRAFADRTTRYIRIYQLSEPGTWQAAGDVEHAAILEALIGGDEHGALTGMAHHLERTALRVLTDCAPDYEPVAVPHAVALIEGQPPAALRLTGTS